MVVDPDYTLVMHQRCNSCENHCLGCSGLNAWPCEAYLLAEELIRVRKELKEATNG